jgi:glycosyltransferase involved in cell wall biosynthesis
MGTVTERRGALTMVQGFAAGAAADWELMIIGGGDDPKLPDRLRREARNLGLGSRFTLTGHLPPDQAMRLVSESLCGLALLHPCPNIVRSLPTKVFDYLIVGVPVLLSDFPFYREFFEGVPGIDYVDPTDVSAIAREIRRLTSDPNGLVRAGELGRAITLKRFNWDSEASKLLELYAELLSSATGTLL